MLASYMGCIHVQSTLAVLIKQPYIHEFSFASFILIIDLSSNTKTNNFFTRNTIGSVINIRKMKLTVRTWSTLLVTLAIASTTFGLGHYHPPHPDTSAAELQIRNKISLYALAIDAKDYSLLEEVFTTDAVVNFNGTVLDNMPALQAFLTAQLQGLVTEHTISTTVVNFGPPVQQYTPNSTAYLVAHYLGQGNLTGQVLTFYGKYTDLWAFEDGSWKSWNRNLTFFVSFENPFEGLCGGV